MLIWANVKKFLSYKCSEIKCERTTTFCFWYHKFWAFFCSLGCNRTIFLIPCRESVLVFTSECFPTIFCTLQISKESIENNPTWFTLRLDFLDKWYIMATAAENQLRLTCLSATSIHQSGLTERRYVTRIMDTDVTKETLFTGVTNRKFLEVTFILCHVSTLKYWHIYSLPNHSTNVPLFISIFNLCSCSRYLLPLLVSEFISFIVSSSLRSLLPTGFLARG